MNNMLRKGTYGRYLIPVLIGIVLTPVFGELAFLSMGFGHGNYVLAVLLFPLPMILAVLLKYITHAVLYTAAMQWPLYGLILAFGIIRSRAKLFLQVLTLCHIALILLAVLTDRSGQFLRLFR